MTRKELNRQLARTAGGQDLWPRKSVAHTLRKPSFFRYDPEWSREYIKRGLGNPLAGPTGRLPA
jgi:hypothetical protein